MILDDKKKNVNVFQLCRYFKEQDSKYKSRKEREILLNQVQNMYSYVMSMRWVIHGAAPHELCITENNVRKVAQMYNFHPDVVDQLCAESQIDG